MSKPEFKRFGLISQVPIGPIKDPGFFSKYKRAIVQKIFDGCIDHCIEHGPECQFVVQYKEEPYHDFVYPNDGQTNITITLVPIEGGL